jgi:voltage-gated potassium channel
MRDALGRFISHAATEVTIGVLIVASVALTVAEVTVADAALARDLNLAGDAITLVFFIELSIRWYAGRSTRWFLRHYWIDCLALLPIIRPLRVLRVLRLLRLVRLGILFTRRSRKFASALHEGLTENLLVFIVLVIVLLVGSVGMTVLERGNPAFDSFEKSLWWSLFTLMAGEPIPGGEVATTIMGKLLAAVVMLGGFTVFAMFTGVVSAVMVQRLRGRMEAKEMELDELRNHYVICGWNRAVPVIVAELQADPQTAATPIVLIAEQEEEPDFGAESVNRGLIFFLRGDYTSTETLRRSRVDRAAAAILVADKSRPRSDQDRDARTILAALTIEKLNPGIFTSAELLHRDNDAHLRMAGVENIVIGDEYMGNIIAHSSRAYGLVHVLDELLTSTHGNEFYRVPVPAELVGQTALAALQRLKESRNAILVAVERVEEGRRRTVTNPAAEFLLAAEDRLVVIAAEPPEAS